MSVLGIVERHNQLTASECSTCGRFSLASRNRVRHEDGAGERGDEVVSLRCKLGRRLREALVEYGQHRQSTFVHGSPLFRPEFERVHSARGTQDYRLAAAK